jgi:hypothetical protein
MKTIKRGDEVKRVSEKEAMFFVRNGWNYCPKNEYKSDRKKSVKVDEVEVTNNISDKKKRKLRKENKRKKYQNN